MYAFTIGVVLILTVLFVMISIIPLLSDQLETGSHHRSSGIKKNNKAYKVMPKYPN